VAHTGDDKAISVGVTQSEVVLTGAQTKLAEAQYDYKIVEAVLAYAAGLTSVPNGENLLP